MIRFGMPPKRFWRPIVGIVAAYAIAVQSLLIGLATPLPPANAADGSPGFELCHHEAEDTAGVPAGSPDHDQSGHCIFCIAGPHQVLLAPPPALFHRVQLRSIAASWTADKHVLFLVFRYSIPHPRGPPVAA